ncbi:Uncharacterized protein APZ42_027754 [Daphnia magna]|uniref:Uncharacterized protein n=1 Tax=Daphnia magna TaxID=35525 RepID=A0A164R2B2_9CRUS|nr:Uncharacterized protein APZ42_027754 [Daphnia magna]
MQTKTNPRLPSCHRDPSRRLHSPPDVSTALPGGESTANSRTPDSKISTYRENLAVSLTALHQQQLQCTAMAAVTKLIRPSNFRGSPTEDARQWLESYETISTYNSWGDADQRNIFSMYLDDTARNEFLCAKLLNDWQDTAAHATAGGNPATSAVPAVQSTSEELLDYSETCVLNLDEIDFGSSEIWQSNCNGTNFDTGPAVTKEAYDACHRELYFQAGDLLLVWKPFPRSEKIRKASSALATPAPVNYEVISETGRGKSDIVHVAQMKSFHEATMEWHSPQALVSGSAETASEKGQQKIKNNIRGTRSTCLDRSTTSD